MSDTENVVLQSLSQANSYNRIKNFFYEDKRIKPYFDEISEECIRDNCQSEAVMFVLTIEKLLTEIENLKSENDYLNNKVININKEVRH